MAAPRRKPTPKAKPVAVPGLSSRPAWQGHLRLSLVSCAVGLYKATTAAGDISFNLINPETGNRIKMVTTDPDTGPVERSTLVKGYAVEKNNYVLFSEDDFEAVKLETTRTLEIERFVDADTIDRLYWDTPYVLVPQDEGSAQAYAVIQQAMVQANRIALGRVVMHPRAINGNRASRRRSSCHDLAHPRRGGQRGGGAGGRPARKARQANDRYRAEDH